jgi:Flp pilus assembly protein TadD
LARGKPAQAEAACREALRLDPKLAGAYNNLGAALKDQGKLAEAVAAFREGIRLDPKDAAIRYHLGQVLEAQGKLDEAAAAYGEAVRLRPGYAEAHCNLGVALVGLGKPKEAEAACRTALRLDPQDAIAHNTLGNALRRQGKMPEAAAAYGEAVRLRPGYAEAHCNLGIALRFQGQFRASLDALRRGHELGMRTPGWRHPTAQWVRHAEVLLERDALLPVVLRGEAEPVDAAERLALAKLCQDYKRLYAAAARLYAGAFAEQPRLADDLRSAHRYNAACAAVLAGCGQGADAPSGDPERTRWRRQAFDWLRADLALWARQLDGTSPQARTLAQRKLRHWQADADLAHVRDREALAELPEPERKRWQKLWADVAALLARDRDQK